MARDEMGSINTQKLAEDWHAQFAKAFITQVSTGDGEYFIKVKFKTMAEMHAAYDAMAKLADASIPTDGAK